MNARTEASYSEVLRALFPSASITGAPKVATSRLIRRLETGPRGAYTGSIGFLAPGRRAQLNVAIRTATVDRDAATATYGTGGGIVWDSDSEAEYQECRAKALVLNPSPPEFALLETLLWRPRSVQPAKGRQTKQLPTGGQTEDPPTGTQTGYRLLDRHLDRLLASARFFDFHAGGTPIEPGPSTRAAVIEALQTQAAKFPPMDHRVRLLVHRDGRIEITATPLNSSGRSSWTLVLDDRPIDDADPFLFHKTTARGLYEQALKRHPEADEVVLWNARGELTETTRANLVLKIDGKWLTPPVACGLLAGTYRAELLARGQIHEQILKVAAIEEAEEIFLINSVRGWIRTEPPSSTTPTIKIRRQTEVRGMTV